MDILLGLYCSVSKSSGITLLIWKLAFHYTCEAQLNKKEVLKVSVEIYLTLFL